MSYIQKGNNFFSFSSSLNLHVGTVNNTSEVSYKLLYGQQNIVTNNITSLDNLPPLINCIDITSNQIIDSLGDDIYTCIVAVKDNKLYFGSVKHFTIEKMYNYYITNNLLSDTQKAVFEKYFE